MGTVWSLEDEKMKQEERLGALYGNPEDREGYENFKRETRSKYDRLVGEGKIQRSYFFADQINVPPECENVVKTGKTNYHNALWGWSDAVNYDAYLESLNH